MAGEELVISRAQGVTVATIRSTSLLEGPEIASVASGLNALVDEQAIRRLIVDFRHVRNMTSQMLGSLVKLNKDIQAIGGKLVICGLREELRKLFKITQLEKIFTFAPDETEAMRKLLK